MKEILPLPSDVFALFQELIMEACGLRFEEERGQSLHLALWERLQQRGYDSYQEYYNLLRFHSEGRLEVRDLLDLITVDETFFFRNTPQFSVLMNSVLPEIIQRKLSSRDKSIRVWSAGCSRGDEPYSIAIAIREVLPCSEEWSISILGTDINRNALTCAKEAAYGEKDIAHLPKEYLQKYFKVEGSTYLLNPDVKQWVQFDYHNLAKGPFVHEKMQMIDLIFCRNVTIYFNAETTRRVIEDFYQCLAPEGYLFLGHTETLWQITDKYERLDFPQTFIYQKRSGLPREGVLSPFMAAPVVEVEDLISAPSSDPPAPPEKNDRLASLSEATLLANNARYKEAADLLVRVIKADNLSVEAYYLLGVLCYRSGDLREAETQFKKVIYVNPDSILAYFNLGNIYLCEQRFREAAREFKNAIRLSEKRPKDEQIRFCEDFTVEYLLMACRSRLREISERGERYE